MNQLNRSKSFTSTQFMTRVAILSVISFLIMYIQVPLAFIAPPFMQVDASDVPALIGGFAMGPFAGIAIEFFKNTMTLLIKGSSTSGVGELSNFIVGSTFVGIASFVYKGRKTYGRAFIGLFLGTISMSFVAVLSNYFFVFPLYGKIMGLEGIIQMGNAVSSSITDLWTMMIYSVAPFNLIKGFILSILTLLIYKKVSSLLH